MIYIGVLVSIFTIGFWRKYKKLEKPVVFSKHDIVRFETNGEMYKIISVNNNQHLLRNINKDEVISISMTESSPFYLEDK